MPIVPDEDLNAFFFSCFEDMYDVHDGDEKKEFAAHNLYSAGDLRRFCADCLDGLVENEFLRNAILNTVEYAQLWMDLKNWVDAQENDTSGEESSEE
jgi:hypothetical protein